MWCLPPSLSNEAFRQLQFMYLHLTRGPMLHNSSDPTWIEDHGVLVIAAGPCVWDISLQMHMHPISALTHLPLCLGYKKPGLYVWYCRILPLKIDIVQPKQPAHPCVGSNMLKSHATCCKDYCNSFSGISLSDVLTNALLLAASHAILQY